MQEERLIAEDHHVLTIAYELYENDQEGELLEVMNVKYPFEFLMGNGNLLPAFEEHLRGKPEGASFDFTLRPDEAYGKRNKEEIIYLPKHIFTIDGVLPEDLLIKGNALVVTDDNGVQHPGKVVEIKEEEVLMDFNHAMAGKTLYFTGVILKVRKATVDELIRKHHIPDNGAHTPW